MTQTEPDIPAAAGATGSSLPVHGAGEAPMVRGEWAQGTGSKLPVAHRGTLLALRLLWAATGLVQLVLAGAVALWVGTHVPTAAATPAAASTPHALLLAALVGLPLSVFLGYHLRNQTYKKHWCAQSVTPRGYFVGNQVLFMLCAADSTLALVAVLAGGSWWPGAVVPIVFAVVMAINYPHGKPMEAASL